VDNLTHSLFAVTLGRTPLARAGRGTTAALVISSNIPDIDIVTTAAGAISYLQWHRGPTHGPVGVVALALVAASLAWLWRRWRDRTRDRSRDVPGTDASFVMLVVVSIIGIVLHVLMDFPTSYGVRFLSPFDWHWFAVDWMPIVDVYLIAAFVIGLLFGAVSDASRRRNAAIVLALMAANYGVRAVAHHEALVLAPRLFGPALPDNCDSPESASGIVDRWPRSAVALSRTPGRRCLVEIAAMPTFISPFRWRLIAHMSNAYEMHDIDLLDRRLQPGGSGWEGVWRTTLRYPNIWTPAVMKAAETRLGGVYLGFSRFPAARAFVDPTGTATVRWSDMRFVGGLLTLDQPQRRPDPFIAVVRIGPDGQVIEERLGR
jgi:inner membrane protein